MDLTTDPLLDADQSHSERAAAAGQQAPGKGPARPRSSILTERARRRFKSRTALVHALVGVLFGYLVLHPIAMAVFAWLEPARGSGSLDFVVQRVVHSFSFAMLPMAIVFAVFSAVIGAMDGYYRSLVRFQRDDLAAQLTVNERYRRRLEAQNSDLEELSRSKQRMTNFLVHDLKNHLGCVLGYAKLLLTRHEGATWSHRDRDAVRKISRQASRMAGAVRDVLDMARLEQQPRLTTAPVPVAQLLEAARSSAALGPGEGTVRIDNDVSEELEVDCDGAMLERVLGNLVYNAVHHNGDHVTVNLGAEPERELVVLSCTDDGHGIPDAVRGQLFDEFASSSRDDGPSPSYGLGLAFCRAAVEAHGGQIEFETEPGKGTTFRVSLPIRQPAVHHGEKGNHADV